MEKSDFKNPDILFKNGNLIDTILAYAQSIGWRHAQQTGLVAGR